MSLYPSIYDLQVDALASLDFSRPLFVQASPSASFNEIVDAIHGRLGLRPERSTLLTNARHPARPWWPGRQFANPQAHLSAATAQFVAAREAEPFSIVVTTTTAPIGDYYPSMRHHSNVAAFCHAMEPAPALVINVVGQFTSARSFFLIADHAVGPARFTANMLIRPDEADALYHAAVSRPAGYAMEIGRFSGGTAVLLALADRQARQGGVVSVDAERLPAAEYFLAINGVDAVVELVDRDSLAAAADWARRPRPNGISLLFIDADHSYDAVVADLAAWLPFVVGGGTVALHDASTPDCGVAKAVYQHLVGRDGFANFRQVGTTIFCERVAPSARCA
jgi:predicted O-methyltransferase YrrM